VELKRSRVRLIEIWFLLGDGEPKMTETKVVLIVKNCDLELAKKITEIIKKYNEGKKNV